MFTSATSLISAIEDAYMIGYPKGIWDSFNNSPIVREGITATPLYLDYQKRKEFLVDIPLYRGSSGSPIVLYDRDGTYVKDNALIQGSRLFLIGINYAGVYYNAEGEGVLRTERDFLPIKTKTNLPMNLAVAVKAVRLLDFLPILEELIGE